MKFHVVPVMTAKELKLSIRFFISLMFLEFEPLIYALVVSSQSRKKGWLLAEEVQMRYRREGLFFDETLSDQLRTVKKKRGKGL